MGWEGDEWFRYRNSVNDVLGGGSEGGESGGGDKIEELGRWSIGIVLWSC